MAVLLFDSQGTLVDPYTIADVIEPHVTGTRIAQAISYDWRQQVKWYVLYTTAADYKISMLQANEAAFRWALDNNDVRLREKAIADILSKFHQLRAYPDVPSALKSLKAQGHVNKIVANPGKPMLEAQLEHAGILTYFDEVVATFEEVGVFKPHPKTFKLGLKKAGVPWDECLWVTSHLWEAVGAHQFGFKTAWTNRLGLPIDRIGFEPTYVTKTLLELARRLKKQGGRV